MRIPLRAFAVVIGLLLVTVGAQAHAHEPTAPSAWLDQLDREHHSIVPRSGHVHAAPS
jgi:hypothetical protein